MTPSQTLPPALVATNRAASAGTECTLETTVKHMCQEIPFTPPMVLSVGLTARHSTASGDLDLIDSSMMPFCCCTVFFGLCTPLPTERNPELFGPFRAIHSLSYTNTFPPPSPITTPILF